MVNVVITHSRRDFPPKFEKAQKPAFLFNVLDQRGTIYMALTREASRLKEVHIL
jgi:hypothetical protein